MKKKRSIAPFFIFLLLICVIGLGCVAAYEYAQIQDKDETIGNYADEIELNKKDVYVALRTIHLGEKIVTEGEYANVEFQVMASGLDESYYITDAEDGQTAVVQIEAGCPVMLNMVTPKEAAVDERFVELVETLPMTTQNNYDTIDVRVVFPNGEDYLVLTNKQVTDLNLTACLFTVQMTEDEIMRYQSACVDAYLTGGMLYTTKYVEPTLQTGKDILEPDYPVRSIVADITMNWDKNTKYDALVQTTLNKQARRKLAERLGLTEDDLLVDPEDEKDPPTYIKDSVVEGFNEVEGNKKGVLSERAGDYVDTEEYYEDIE